MNYADLIEINPDVMVGKPVIRGTRITVELILEKLSVGQTHEEILASHPRLTNDAILAALWYATQSLKNEINIGIAS